MPTIPLKLALVAVACLICVVATQAMEQPSPQFVRLMNLGKAHLENRDSAKAIEALNQAVKLQPKSAAAWRNLGRAHFLAGDFQAALARFTEASKFGGASAATEYLTGLALVRTSKFEAAVEQFENAVRLAPDTAALRYQLASAYQAVGRHEKAKEQLLATLELDPLHASARFKLGAYARQARDQDAFRRHMAEFTRLRKIFGEETRSVDALEQCRYTAPEPPVADEPAARRPEPIEVRFVDATAEMLPDGAKDVTAACVLDVDEKGNPTTFVADRDGATGVITPAGDGLRRRNAGVTLPRDFQALACRSGDFHNDVPQDVTFDFQQHARSDVLVLGSAGIRLLKLRPGGDESRFHDVTEQAGLQEVSARDAAWVDYEHDGDLDLLLATSTGVRLWQNNGDGTFKEVSAEVGVTGDAAATGVAAVDLDNNVAVDLIVAHGEQPTRVFINQRTGRFAPTTEPPGPWPPAQRVFTNDLTNDGHADVVHVGTGGVVTMLNRHEHRPRIELDAMRPTSGAVFDFDNDGWLDLALAGSTNQDGQGGFVRLWRNSADGAAMKWADATAAAGLSSVKFDDIRDLFTVDVDVDGDTDLLLVPTRGGLRILRNEGGNANRQLKLDLVTVKTNPSAIGTRIEVRHGTTRIARVVTRPVVEVGVGGLEKLDSVQTVWTNGVIENQVDVEPGVTPVSVKEKVVATGSCPFLYAWGGEGFRFVTDILGNAPLGLPLSRGVMLPADWDEIVLVGTADDFVPRKKRYTVQITEEFCEVLYLDAARLIAVDHPQSVEVHSTDKLMPEPFPPSQVWALHNERSPVRAIGDDGVDRTDAVATIDDVYAPPGRLLPPPFRGSCHPLALTLDFGSINVTRPLVLALTGWLRYGQASTNIALSQNGTYPVIPPKLEAETQDGWQPVEVVVGMPAGKTKTILVDLAGKLPADTRRLRLTTTFEIAWDRIALMGRTDLPPGAIHELRPAAADLNWRGFSEIKVRVPGGPDTPQHAAVSDRPSWRLMMEGWCTRYGEVGELVAEVDERIAIINAGDALTLGFDARPLPRVPPGMTRTFFFYSYGIEKDCDHNVTDGDTVGPLPIDLPVPEGDGAPEPWWLKYNTRFVPRDALIDTRH